MQIKRTHPKYITYINAHTAYVCRDFPRHIIVAFASLYWTGGQVLQNTSFCFEVDDRFGLNTRGDPNDFVPW